MWPLSVTIGHSPDRCRCGERARFRCRCGRDDRSQSGCRCAGRDTNKEGYPSLQYPLPPFYVCARQVSELVGSVCMGLADIVTDAFAGARLLSGDVVVPNEGYKVAYVLFLCLGVLTTAVSLACRLRNARLVRKKLLEQSQQGRIARASAARRQAQQHEWELAQTRRANTISWLALLSVAAQGVLPLCAAS